ncbi:MAG TPA: class I SAM-dependent methyltransferase [Acidimicrobiales bacterium]
MADDLLEEQIAYYRERAPEYDRWWHRTHQYELPPEKQAMWHREVAEVEALADDWVLAGGASPRVLEYASGTGLWTARLAPIASSVVAVDAAPETIAINRSKLEAAGMADRVGFVEADAFAWQPPAGEFDVVFFSFWLSHVPPDLFDAFWANVRRALRPGGRAILLDNRWNDGVYPSFERRPDEHDPVQVRTDLSSGATYRVVKLYYEPDELEQRLAGLGWDAHVAATERFFLVGWATPRA